MSHKLASAGLALSLLAGAAGASSEINLGISSEYVFRGVPQSDGAQVWASLDYSFDSIGAYVGAWVSNAGFTGWVAETGNAGNEEVDVYAGYAMRLGETLSVDIGGIGYFDPSAGEAEDGVNRSEAYLGMNWERLNTYAYYGFGTTIADEDEYAYFEANYEFDLLADAYLRVNAGYFLGTGEYYEQFADDDYAHYGLSFIKDYGMAGQVALAVTGTTIGVSHGLTALNPVLESERPQFTVGWSRSFGAAF